MRFCSILSLVFILFTVDSHELQSVSNDANHLLFVISLDGKITAIDIEEKGRQLWVTDTGAPLVNSTLSKIELSRKAKSFRLIPSLIGGLYEKSNEDETMQPLPFDAESLLNTSAQFHDELIMTGGKDIDTLGLDLRTGKVVYSFFNENFDQTTSMLVVKRIRKTVRARSMFNGYEKWVFSVSHHELIYLSTDILPSQEPIDRFIFEYQLHTGLVLAFDYQHHLVWTSSIGIPIAAVWELNNGQLREKSLFNTRLSHGLAFMGEFNSTPYVIIAPRTQRQLIEHAKKSNFLGSANNQGVIVSSSRIVNQQQLLPMSTELVRNDQQTALAIREDRLKDVTGYLELIDFEKENVRVNRRSTWILPTACLGALIMILMWYSRRKSREFQLQKSIISENHDYQLVEPLFQSRYTTEYEHIRFLGRGGFGVVFEATNKLDERRVAIKRVSLKKSSGKERALKEIRCLAILNHPNLIQYYYAWNECPPTDWQAEVDKESIVGNNDITMFSTSAGSEDDDQAARLRSSSCLSPIIDFTFERSLHSSAVDEEGDSSEEEISKSSMEKESSDVPTTYFYFVMELCQSESLRDRLIKQTIPSSEVWSTIDQIIQGIEYIHSRKLIHRDLKPSNILFSFDNTIKIGDFGLVSTFGEEKIERADQLDSHEMGGTILYMSPEQINRQSYNQKVDIYAIGIILFELLHPFSTQMERIRALSNIRLPTPVFPLDFQSNQLICRLIGSLLAHSPSDRPKACELRKDHFYQTMLKEL